MKTGYRVLYYSSTVDKEGGQFSHPDLPDHVLCDESLEQNLGRITQFLGTWISQGSSCDPSGGSIRNFGITLLGPFLENACVPDRRTPEQRLAEAESPQDRFHKLGAAANSQFNAGKFEEARKSILELQQLLPDFEDDFGYSTAFERVHSVLGRLALMDGDIQGAKAHLLHSADFKGSPTMSSFGPNMSLARDLLLAGEKEIVLQYLEACRQIWDFGADDLDHWTMYVNADRIPDFGANLDY